MAKLKIRIFRGDDPAPDVTVTVPLGVLKVASRMIPRKVAAVLEEHGIDLDQIVDLSKFDEPLGTLVEIEEHKKNKKMVLAIE